MAYGHLRIDKQKVFISSKHSLYDIIQEPFKHKGKQHEGLGKSV